MPTPLSNEQNQQWKEKILKQRESGLSITRWCFEHNLSPHVFHYWKKKHFPKPVMDRSDFYEVSQENIRNVPKPKVAGIALEFQGVRIHLDREFDQPTLKRCLVALKEVAC
jgi:hypothetical protein